jgi:multidrug transporter EmrE-like cation transporter
MVGEPSREKEAKMHPLWILVIAISLGVIGQLFLKQGLTQLGEYTLKTVVTHLPQIFSNLLVLGGFLCYLVSSILWIVVVSRVPLSYAYPMIGLGYVFIVLLSIIIFKEEVSLVRWIGVGAICLGVFLISRTH